MNTINLQKISKKRPNDLQKAPKCKNDFRRQRRDAAKAKRRYTW